MKNFTFDFYNSSNLRAYNLNDTMREQLAILNRLEPITKKHSENVANIVCRICEYKGFNWQATIHATMNAYLHDVGKLTVPPEVLNKPGKLTEEEFKIMQSHTINGYNILIKDINMRPYADGALYHHEALNGTGYPNHLTRKDIPYVAQIIRVADEYEAITAKRQYKTHVSISDTLKILLKEAYPEDYGKAVALDQLKINEKVGKINADVLKVLFKVVIDDIYYEISCLDNYIKYINAQIKRLETAEKYYEKMQNSSKDKDKSYFLEGVKMLLAPEENLENFHTILKEYKDVLVSKEENVKKLYNEIKIIKKLKP